MCRRSSSGVEVHDKGCRPGRPLCSYRRAQNPKRKACGCGVYHYPHRIGSGACGNPFFPFVSNERWMELKKAHGAEGARRALDVSCDLQVEMR